VSLSQPSLDHCRGEPGDVGGGRTAVSLSQPSPDHCQGGRRTRGCRGGRTAAGQRANHNLTNAKNSRESDASGTSFFKTYLNIVECIYKAKCLEVRFLPEHLEVNHRVQYIIDQLFPLFFLYFITY
jgi:hypothetical protein